MFCPECRSEYRIGFTRCSDCGVTLVDELPPEPVRTSADDPGLVRLRSYSNDTEAFLARSVLEAAGIDAIVSPPRQPVGLPHYFGRGLTGTDVYVRPDDFIEANEILLRVDQA